MPIQFPATPTTNQLHTTGGRTWVWDGAKWKTTTTATANLMSLGSHIMPAANVTYDLGHTNYRWRDLYLSGNTIDLGGTSIKSNANIVTLTNALDSNIAIGLNVGTLQIGTGANAVTLLSSPTGLQTITAGNVLASTGGASVTVGNTAPTSPTEGSLWLDSDTGDLSVFFGNSWAEVTGGTGSTGSSVPIGKSIAMTIFFGG